MNCPQCRQPLKGDAPFCTNCGARTGVGERYSLSDSISTAGGGGAKDPTAATVVSTDPLAGRVLDGKYELLARLGEGGMGAVYRARRVHIGDEVAVKILHPKFITDESAVERFRREARAAAQLHHANVVIIHDYGEAKGAEDFAYIVMELLNGISLRDLLRNAGRLPAERAVSLVRDICAGVAAAHRRNIVHRDIKPDNVIVLAADDDRERETVKVVDFGIAKLRDIATDHTLTQAGTLVGTPYYMAPEQCRGEDLDTRADVYSLGALLYEMLAGSPPFTAPTVTGVIAKHLTEPPPRLAPGLGVPPALEGVVFRALSKDAGARQADAAEFARDIQAALAHQAAPPPQPQPPAPQQPAASPQGPQGPPQPVVPPQHTPYPQQHPQPHPARVSSPQIPSQTAPPGFTPQTHPFAPPPTAAAPPRRSRAPLVIGVIFVLMLIGGGIGAVMLVMENDDDARTRNDATGTRNTAVSNTATANIANTVANADNRGPEIALSPAMQRAEQKILSGETLTADDLKGLSPADLRILRNAVFARHGRAFDNAELRRYFTSRPWYQPRADFNDAMLTPTDRANAELVKAAETPPDPSKVRAEVKNTLEGWAETTRDHDLDAHMKYYADTLETYYNRRNVTTDALRGERERAFNRYQDFEVKIENLKIEPDPTGTRATATFDKTWQFTADDRISSGSVQQQLTLVKVGGNWRITGEKELKVYYTNTEDTPTQ